MNTIAQEAKPVSKVLITNANIFDGKSEKFAEGISVLIDGNKIAKIAESIPVPSGATVIDAKGRTMTPGFIAAHEHLIGQVPFNELTNDTRYMAYAAVETAKTYLMKGFTTVRDAAGNTYSLKNNRKDFLKIYTDSSASISVNRSSLQISASINTIGDPLNCSLHISLACDSSLK